MGLLTRSKLTEAFLARECKPTKMVHYVEIFLDHCANINATAPCNATELCHNTPSTCRDRCNYACGHRSIWLTDCTPPASFPHDAIPNLIEWDETPPLLDLGNVFGTRARISLKFADHPHNDNGIDPYQDRRYPVIPICDTDVPGTFWGRLRARHKTLRQRMVKFYTGPRDGVFPDDFEVHEYVISEHGRDGDGNMCIEGLDILFLAGNDDAKCPGVQTGQTKEFITTVDGPYEEPRLVNVMPADRSGEDNFEVFGQYFWLSQNFEDKEVQPGGLLHNLTEVCIDKELMAVLVQRENGPDSTTGYKIYMRERGICDTEIVEHKRGARIVIPFKIPKGQHAVTAMRRLLEECADINASVAGCCDSPDERRICEESYQEVIDCNPDAVIGRDIYICDDEGVTDLLNELATDYMLHMFVDQRSNEIRFKSLNQPPPCREDLPVLEQCNIIGAIESTTDFDDQAGTVTVDYAPVDKLEAVTEDNAQRTLGYINSDAAKPKCERVEYINTRSLNRTSRWYHWCIDYLIETYLIRLAQWMRCEPEVFRVRHLVATWPDNLWTGDYMRIAHKTLQNADGLDSDLVLFIRSVKVNAKGDCYELTARTTPFSTRYNYVNSIECKPGCGLVVDVEPSPNCDPACDNIFY